MKFLYKYPTRRRPEWFKKTLKTYYEMKGELHPFEFVVSLDEDDETMNCDSMIQFMNSYPNLTYKFGNNKSKVQACNADMENLEWDILVLVSDDMIPVVKEFDNIIVEKMKEFFPDLDGALHFYDGFQGDKKNCTLSIMGRKLYKRFGYIYHPAYKSFFCDREYTDEIYRMGKAVYFNQIIIQHEWSGGPKSTDALYRRNSMMGRKDRRTYKKRKALRC